MWTTLQFYWRLGFEVTIASSFLKHALHLTLPLIATVAIVHTFKEYCRGRDGGGMDFVALATLYVFVFHLMMGVRLVRPAPLRFGVGGGGGGVPWPWGRGRGTMARESGRSSGGHAVALSGRWWRNGMIVGMERGQRECCGVGGASVVGWDGNGSGCAAALLGQ